MTISQTLSADEQSILFSIGDDGIARVRLNRPKSANGLDLEFLKSLHSTILACHSEPRIRAVIITGEGKNFCAGGDVRVFASQGEELPQYLREVTAWLQLTVEAMIQLEAPVISAVQGFAAGGGGFGLVCASDFVIAAETAKFMSGAVRVGMAPDAGASVTLTQLVGFRKATEILLTNPTLSAHEALDIGLLTSIVPAADLEEEALSFARQFTHTAPQAIGATKRLLWGGVGATVMNRLPEEARTVSELSGTGDSREGLAAVIERRDPVFTGL